MKLIKMRDYLNILMESFSSLIEIESTIIDAEPLQRVVWTSGYHFATPVVYNGDGSLIPMWQNSYTLKVIKTGIPITALDTSAYRELCPEFNGVDWAEYYSLLLYPIISDGIVEGVVVLASFNAYQQRLLEEKHDDLYSYMKNFSELIVSRLKEERMTQELRSLTNQLNIVINALQDGIILWSPEDGILQINEHAKHYLHFSDAPVKNVLLQEVVKAALQSQRSEYTQCEIHKVIEGVQFSLSMHMHRIDEAKAVLCVLNPFSRIQDEIVQTEKGKDVSREIIFSGYQMRDLIGKVQLVANNNLNVLITGESGTGKELIARMIHANGNRKNKPFVSLNCAAIPETLLESELFGYEEGAFTGARRGGKIGKFMLANQGTLFLDEIGEMPLYLQAKLLRVLSERKVDKIGGNDPVDIDVRIVTATNRNLEEMIITKEFREDLYYRLSVVPFHIPALRERKEDLFVLASYFLNKYNEILGKSLKGISDEVMAVFRRYTWPGNVRELENTIEYMMTFENQKVLTAASIPLRIRKSLEKGRESDNDLYQPLKQSLERYENEILKKIIEERDGVKTKEEVEEVCRILQISPASWYRKVSRIEK